MMTLVLSKIPKGFPLWIKIDKHCTKKPRVKISHLPSGRSKLQGYLQVGLATSPRGRLRKVSFMRTLSKNKSRGNSREGTTGPQKSSMPYHVRNP
jgi:hypothetical protein